MANGSTVANSTTLKRYSTKFLRTAAYAYFFFPLVYLLATIILFDVPLAHVVKILLSPTFYIFSLTGILTGYGLFEMRWWAWYVFLANQVLMVYTNAVISSSFGESHHKAIAFFVAVFFSGLFIFRVARELRVPYLLPKIRWWENDPRYRLSAPVEIHRESGQEIKGDVLDVSMGGCFIKLRDDLMQDESVQLTVHIFGMNVKLVGSIVWRTQSAVTHPKGVGVKFGPHTKNERRALKAITLRLKKIAYLYRSSRYLMSRDEFSKRMEDLQGVSSAAVRLQTAVSLPSKPNGG